MTALPIQYLFSFSLHHPRKQPLACYILLFFYRRYLSLGRKGFYQLIAFLPVHHSHLVLLHILGRLRLIIVMFLWLRVSFFQHLYNFYHLNPFHQPLSQKSSCLSYTSSGLHIALRVGCRFPSPFQIPD